MRLVCPNCGAQYEVPADAIPPAGRDVQCSACGHTWFEGDADLAALDSPLAGVPRVEEDEEEADDLADAAWREAPPPGEAVEMRPPRSTVTPEVAEILRSEAEREARARATERPAASQLAASPGKAPPPPEGRPPARDRPAGGAAPTEAPVAPPGRAAVDATTRPAPGPFPEPVGGRERLRAEEARRRMARLRTSPAPSPAPSGVARPPIPGAPGGVAAVPPPVGAPAAASPAARPAPPRRTRLPDIEEINSSLRGAPSAAPAAPPPATRSGFRLGFGGMLLLGAALALAYAYAPQVTGAVPASRVALDPYVAAVDEGRLWLDLRLQRLLRAVDGPDEAAPANPAPADPGPADPAAGDPAAVAEPPASSSPVPSRPEAPPPDALPADLPEGLAAPEPDDLPATQTLTVPVTEPGGP